MESAYVRDFHTSWWSIWSRTSERGERVRFLIQNQRVWKSRTKRFPCCNFLFYTYWDFFKNELIKKLNAKRFLKHIIKVNDVSALRYAIIKLKSEEYKTFYRRYVDDTLVSKPNTESATDFLQVLNNVHPSLSFTMELEHDGSIPFLGTVLTRCDDTLTTEVYRKPTDTGLLLHFQSHVDSRYKKGLVNTMVNRAYGLSSTKEGFAKEYNKLRAMFSKLHYPKRLVDSSIDKFSQEPDKEIYPLPSADPSVYIVLPFKDQRSADRVRRDIYSLGAKIDVNVKPIFTSKKLLQTLSVKENKPPIVNTQCVVYLFQCDLCDANYVGYTARHLHQRITEHRYSAIGKHLETQHGNNRRKIDHLFKVLRKCKSKFDCLVYEMLYIKDIKPSLNTQADSIRAKLITWHFYTFLLLLLFSFWVSYTHRTPKHFMYIFFSNIIYSLHTLYSSLFNLIMA